MSVIEVHGNIGSGKSSVLEALAVLKPGLEVVFEDLDAWSHLLEKMYGDPKKWLAAFQLKVASHYLDVAEKIDRDAAGTTYVLERGHTAVTKVFLPASVAALGQETCDGFSRVIDEAMAPFEATQKATVVYLRAPVDVCLARTAARARPGEEAVTREYLETLHKLHEDTFGHFLTVNVTADMSVRDVALAVEVALRSIGVSL